MMSFFRFAKDGGEKAAEAHATQRSRPGRFTTMKLQ